MQNKQPDDGDVSDLLIESTNNKKLERPKKLQSLIDTQAMRFLEAMDFQSFNNLSNAFEKFMMEAPLFHSDTSFAGAAIALDLTAQLFSTIDTDKNHLLSREEFAYLLLKTTEANRQALSWLIENFNAFTQACFFKDQIGKDDIEAARNVFHGLKIAHEKFGFSKQPTLENLQHMNADQLKEYLDNNSSSMNQHEATGLKYLLDHIKKHAKSDDRNKKNENTDGTSEFAEDNLSQGPESILDRRSLRTLYALKLNSFESLLDAFAEFIEDTLSFSGDTPFSKATNAFDTTANLISELEMGNDHLFSRDELTIVAKLTSSRDKKQVSWIAKHFDAFAKVFLFPGKAKKKDILAARNVFHGLGFVRERFDCEDEASLASQQPLDKQVKSYFANHHNSLEPHNKAGLEQLIDFMERHSG